MRRGMGSGLSPIDFAPFPRRLLVEYGRKKRHTFSQPDLIIAATASHHGLTIVARDTSEYEAAKVPVLNPWTTRL